MGEMVKVNKQYSIKRILKVEWKKYYIVLLKLHNNTINIV